MHEDDIIEIKEALTQMVSILEDIKRLLKESQQQKESKLPRQI